MCRGPCRLRGAGDTRGRGGSARSGGAGHLARSPLAERRVLSFARPHTHTHSASFVLPGGDIYLGNKTRCPDRFILPQSATATRSTAASLPEHFSPCPPRTSCSFGRETAGRQPRLSSRHSRLRASGVCPAHGVRDPLLNPPLPRHGGLGPAPGCCGRSSRPARSGRGQRLPRPAAAARARWRAGHGSWRGREPGLRWPRVSRCGDGPRWGSAFRRAGAPPAPTGA